MCFCYPALLHDGLPAWRVTQHELEDRFGLLIDLLALVI